MTPARRCSLALAVLALCLLALALTPAARGLHQPPVARAAVARPVVVEQHSTHTHHGHSTDTATPCPRHLLDILTGGCGSPSDTPAAGPTFSFTNSAGSVSIPPTATPRPASTPPPTAAATPVPTDSGVSDTTTTTITGGPDTVPPVTGRGSGGGTALALVLGFVLLVVVGGGAGLAVMRLR